MGFKNCGNSKAMGLKAYDIEMIRRLTSKKSFISFFEEDKYVLKDSNF